MWICYYLCHHSQQTKYISTGEICHCAFIYDILDFFKVIVKVILMGNSKCSYFPDSEITPYQQTQVLCHQNIQCNRQFLLVTIWFIYKQKHFLQSKSVPQLYFVAWILNFTHSKCQILEFGELFPTAKFHGIQCFIYECPCQSYF